MLGLSGGIDSALVACLAADALGPERVSAVDHALALLLRRHPGRRPRARRRARTAHATSSRSSPSWRAYEDALRADFAGREPDLTEENLQARIRGNLLMALSNKFGWLVLATGNKSEMSVGYTTLYGDLAGGFAVIKDVPKTLVYRLCTWRNSDDGAIAADAIAPPAGGSPPAAREAAAAAAREPIPLSIIERAPSAELRADQRDEDSLPPYPVLDRILEGYVELDLSREQLIAQGLPAQDVDRTHPPRRPRRVQAPPGAPRHQDHPAGVRARPAHADHQPLPWLGDPGAR